VSVISEAALSRTGKGRAEGPGEKLKTRIFSPEYKGIKPTIHNFRCFANNIIMDTLHGQRI
jgi:hypothetical protein